MTGALAFLRSERSYRTLLTASLISGIGDWFSSIAVLGTPVAITLVVRMVPALLLGPLAGLLADRGSRKYILIFADFARMLIALAFLFVHSTDQLWLSYAATFGLVFFTTFFNPARMALVPELVQPDHLASANGLQESTSGLVMSTGALLGGVVTAAFGVQTAFIVNAVTFLVSALLIMSIDAPVTRRHPTDLTRTGGTRFHTGPLVAEFLSLLRRSRLMQAMLVLEVIWPIGGGVINVLLSVYAVQVFHMGNAGIGLLYGALGIGFGVSGFLTNHFKQRGQSVVLVGLVIEGVCQLGVSLSANIWLASLLLMMASAGAGVSNARLNTLVMQRLATTMLGRVYALFETVSSVTMSLSMFLAGVLLTLLSPRTLGTGAGAVMTISAIGAGLLLLGVETTESVNPSPAIDQDHQPQQS
jgi:predicted MFS family arabinose efflux permease